MPWRRTIEHYLIGSMELKAIVRICCCNTFLQRMAVTIDIKTM